MIGTPHTWNGKAALVTGGSTGLGYATVVALAQRGCRVGAVSQNLQRLGAAIDGIEPAIRDRVVPVPGDVGDPVEVQRAIDRVLTAFGRIDYLINVAGASPGDHRPMTEYSVEDWHRLLDTNLTGMFLMCRAALPHLVDSGAGYIVNVLSTVAHKVAPGATLYSATKYGARGLTQSLVEEYRGTPLRVSSISPGKMNTSVWDSMREPPTQAEREAMMRPADVADVVAWLIERPAHMHIGHITVRPWEF